MVVLVQAKEFSTELKALRCSEGLPRNSKLYNLGPFLDTSGIIRVGGRLSKSQLICETKHPMIIPSKHHLAAFIIHQEHIT